MSNRNQAPNTSNENGIEAQAQLAYSLCEMTNLHAQAEAFVTSLLAQLRTWQDHGQPSEDCFEKMELGWEYLWKSVSDKLQATMDEADKSYGTLVRASRENLITSSN